MSLISTFLINFNPPCLKYDNFIFFTQTHNLISRLAVIHKVGQEDGIFGARESTCSHLTGTFLDGDPLVVLVHRLQEGGSNFKSSDWAQTRQTNYNFHNQPSASPALPSPPPCWSQTVPGIDTPDRNPASPPGSGTGRRALARSYTCYSCTWPCRAEAGRRCSCSPRRWSGWAGSGGAAWRGQQKKKTVGKEQKASPK